MMARNEQSPEYFESLADDLERGVVTLRSIATSIRDNEMSTVLVHGAAVSNTYVPSVLDWIEKTSADVKSQIRSYLAGVPSSAELLKQKNENAKLAAAKKPFTPKAPKKKA